MINCVGLGYIGLPTALMFASHGIEVIGTDYNKELVATLNSGSTTFEEDGLDELFAAAVEAGITFSSEYACCDTYIISVPTPYDATTKKVDASYVVSALKTVLEVAPSSATVIVESTISPGTVDTYLRPIVEASGKQVNLVHAPERIIPGNMIHELEHNNRTIGADSIEVAERVRDLYAHFCKGDIALTDIRTAEMSKVVENTFRDVNIAFANELSRICREAQLDVYEVIRIANKHPRVNILNPGPGVGGHCISVDPWFLVGDYPELTNVIRNARETNDSQPLFVTERAAAVMAERGITDSSRVGIYGLTYKANVDDVRESPTLQMLAFAQDNLDLGSSKVYDPMVDKTIVTNQVHSLEEFLEGLDMVIVMVGHAQLVQNAALLGDCVVLDCCNVCGSGENVYKL